MYIYIYIYIYTLFYTQYTCICSIPMFIHICYCVTTFYIQKLACFDVTRVFREAKTSKMATKHVLDILAVYEASGFLDYCGISWLDPYRWWLPSCNCSHNYWKDPRLFLMGKHSLCLWPCSIAF